MFAWAGQQKQPVPKAPAKTAIHKSAVKTAVRSGPAAARTPATTPARKAPIKSLAAAGARKAPVKGTGVAPKAPARGAATNRRRAPVKPALTWRNRQLAPTADRYREIQQALAAKGFLSPGEANGTWNQSSVDALKQFQAQQKIESTGKINSLSLIALGLGPKHEAVAAKAAVPAPPVVP